MKNIYRVVAFLAIIATMMAAFATANADTAYYRVVTEQERDKVNVRDIESHEALASVSTGDIVEVYAADKDWYYDYEGVRMMIYKDYLKPVDGNAVVAITKPAEKTFSQEGCEHYRVKLTLKKFANVQNSPNVSGGTQKRLFEDDDVWVEKFFSKDGVRWASIILEDGRKRYIEARLIEAVTDTTERLVNPVGEYMVISEDAQILSNARTRKSKTVRNLHAGDVVTVISDDGAWVEVEYTNAKGKVFKGQVRSRYLTLVQPIAQEAPAEETLQPTETAHTEAEQDVYFCDGSCCVGCHYCNDDITE